MQDDRFESLLASFPIQQAAIEKTVECLAVVGFFEVAEFVDDDVVDTVDRGALIHSRLSRIVPTAVQLPRCSWPTEVERPDPS